MATTQPPDPLPAFSLRDQHGGARRFPGGRPALLAFVKEDCPTCRTSLPLIEGAHRAFGAEADVWAIGQDAGGPAALAGRHGLTLPVLDDSALGVSFRYGLDTVPTVLLAGAEGGELRRVVGFGREDWRALYGELAALAGGAPPEVEWDRYPVSEPGCGSRSVEPGIAERLAAQAEGSPLRARRIDIGAADDPDEFMFDQGFTDGLPVVAPTPERVLRMLGGTRRDAQETVAIVPPNLAPATVEKVAINAVLAGCRPEYLPVVIAALEAACTDAFNAHGVMATTMGASPALIVNGPIRGRIGMNAGLGALGQGNRANAAIGRALRLVLRNVGGAKPGGTERSTLGSPAKFTLAFAEREERSPWPPLHAERGHDPGRSVVTAFPATPGPLVCVDQTSRSAGALAGSLAMSLQAIAHPKSAAGNVLLVIAPEHADTLWRGGWTKDRLRERLCELTARPLRELIADERSGAGRPLAAWGPDGPTEEQLDAPTPKFDSPRRIHIVVAGGDAGKFTSIFPGWGSEAASREIEETWEATR